MYMIEKTFKAVFSLKNDFPDFESDRDQQWGMLTGVIAGLKELREEVNRLTKELWKSAVEEKREEVERQNTAVAKKVVTWPKNIATVPRKLPGYAV